MCLQIAMALCVENFAMMYSLLAQAASGVKYINCATQETNWKGKEMPISDALTNFLYIKFGDNVFMIVPTSKNV